MKISHSLDPRLLPLLDSYGSLDRPATALSEDDDLYQAGMSSHDSIQLMMALEAEFGIEFPNEMLTRSAFQSISSIRASLKRLGVLGN